MFYSRPLNQTFYYPGRLLTQIPLEQYFDRIQELETRILPLPHWNGDYGQRSFLGPSRRR